MTCWELWFRLSFSSLGSSSGLRKLDRRNTFCLEKACFSKSVSLAKSAASNLDPIFSLLAGIQGRGGIGSVTCIPPKQRRGSSGRHDLLPMFGVWQKASSDWSQHYVERWYAKIWVHRQSQVDRIGYNGKGMYDRHTTHHPTGIFI